MPIIIGIVTDSDSNSKTHSRSCNTCVLHNTEKTGGSIPCAQPPSTVKLRLDIRDLRRDSTDSVLAITPTQSPTKEDTPPSFDLDDIDLDESTIDKARADIDKEYQLCMVIGQDITNQRKELEEKYSKFRKELHEKLESEFQEQKRKAEEKYKDRITEIKFQYADKIAQEVGDINRQFEEGVENYRQAEELKNKRPRK